jgi:hypothetical protein
MHGTVEPVCRSPIDCCWDSPWASSPARRRTDVALMSCENKWWPIREAARPILTPLFPDCCFGSGAHPGSTSLADQFAARRE